MVAGCGGHAIEDVTTGSNQMTKSHGKIILMQEWPQSVQQLQIIAQQHATYEDTPQNPYPPRSAEWHLYTHYYTINRRKIAKRKGANA